MAKRPILLLLAICCSVFSTFGQGFFSGEIMLNSDFYIRDSAIGAYNTPHYDNLLSGSDGWVSLRYSNPDFDFDAAIRLDAYHNSNLHNPGVPYSATGVGIWYLKKSFNNLSVTAGNFYDQVGSGIIFRTYEDRALGIDNALLGGHIAYQIKESMVLRAFTGVQKNRLELYRPVIKGLIWEGNFFVKDRVNLAPGFGAVNRTLDQESMNNVVNTIEGYNPELRFVPRYNTYAFAAYNTMTMGRFTWYLEGAYKTHEAINDLTGRLIDESGNVLFTHLTYSTRGFGATAVFKRTKGMAFRTSPNETLLNGMISFIPPVNRMNSLRLLSRYNPPSQEVDEMAYGFDLTYTPKKGYTIHLNYSELNNSISGEKSGVVTFENGEHINTLIARHPLWREVYADLEIKTSKVWKGTVGMQFIQYARKFYELKGEERLVAFSPFAEVSYKLDKKKNIRLELQYNSTKQDYGPWLYALLEFTIAPKWSFSVSDMYNYKPNRRPDPISGIIGDADPTHFYNIFTSFTHKTHRFTLAYVKQVEGIVCTGGVCRYEPAFSGVRFSLNSTF